MYLSSTYGVALSIIFIVTFFSAASIIVEVGFDLDISVSSGYGAFLESSYIIAVFMFFASYAGGLFFLRSAPTIVARVSSLPIAIVLLWIIYFLVGQGNLRGALAGEVTASEGVSYMTVTIMVWFLIHYGIALLRLKEKSYPV